MIEDEGYLFVVDVDLKSYFDTISHELLLKKLVERRRVGGGIQVVRLIRARGRSSVVPTRRDRAHGNVRLTGPLCRREFATRREGPNRGRSSDMLLNR